ncbi:MAG: protein TolR [Arenicellales bacterium]
MMQSNLRSRRKKRLMGEINVVPYIDVMLVLLVIFMVTAPLLSTGVDVELPAADARPLDEEQIEPFVLTVDKDGNYYLNDNEAPLESTALAEIQRQATIVLQKQPKTPFMVRGDGDVPYSKIIEGMVLLQQAGVEKVGLATAPVDLN